MRQLFLRIGLPLLFGLAIACESSDTRDIPVAIESPPTVADQVGATATQAPLQPTPSAVPATATQLPTPSPVPEPVFDVLDPLVIEAIGAGPRKEFPDELSPGSPELPEEEVVRLWTEFMSNIYIIENADFVVFACAGGYGGTTSVGIRPNDEGSGNEWEIGPPNRFAGQDWNEARIFVTDEGGQDFSSFLAPPGPDGRFFITDSPGPQNAIIHHKSDCPDPGYPNALPTPLPALPESRPGDERVVPAALLDGEGSLEELKDEWTEFLSNVHMIPTDVTIDVKLQIEDFNPSMTRYLFNAYRINGSFDLLLCGDGRYHWLGTAPINIIEYSKPGWRGGQDGNWEVSRSSRNPDNLVLKLDPDDQRVIEIAFEYLLETREGELVSGRWQDLVFTIFEADGCPG